MTPTAALDPATLARIVPLVEQVRAARREEQSRRDGGRDDGALGSSAPEMSDEKIRAGTGRGWDDWVALVAAGPGREASHTEIATWVVTRQPLDGRPEAVSGG